MKYYDLTINGSEVQRRLDLANHNVLGFDGIIDVPVTASDELITSAESYHIVYAPNGGRGEMLMYVNGAYYRNFRLQSSGKTYLDSSWYNEDGQIRKDRLFLNGAARDIYAYAAGAFGKVERDGVDGQDGSDGITPHIDPTTKHWMLGDEDTGIVAEGQNGQDGVDGTDGQDGKSAFDIWLENGHSGNISDFLAWMKDTSSMIGPKFAATTADCVMANDTPTMYYVPNGSTFNVYLADSDGQGVNAHPLATGVPGDITNYAGIYDISQDKAVNSVPATYGDLQAALGAITDITKKKGGMTIKYIGTDRKYHQYRYVGTSIEDDYFTDEGNWIAENDVAESVSEHNDILANCYVNEGEDTTSTKTFSSSDLIFANTYYADLPTSQNRLILDKEKLIPIGDAHRIVATFNRDAVTQAAININIKGVFYLYDSGKTRIDDSPISDYLGTNDVEFDFDLDNYPTAAYITPFFLLDSGSTSKLKKEYINPQNIDIVFYTKAKQTIPAASERMVNEVKAELEQKIADYSPIETIVPTSAQFNLYKLGNGDSNVRARFCHEVNGSLKLKIVRNNDDTIYKYQINTHKFADNGNYVIDNNHKYNSTILRAWSTAEPNFEGVIDSCDWFSIQIRIGDGSGEIGTTDIADFLDDYSIEIQEEVVRGVIADNTTRIYELYSLSNSGSEVVTDFLTKPKQGLTLKVNVPTWIAVKLEKGLRASSPSNGTYDRDNTENLYNGDTIDLDYTDGGVRVHFLYAMNATSQLEGITKECIANLIANGKIILTYEDDDSSNIISRNYDAEKYLGAIRTTIPLNETIPNLTSIVHVSDIHGDAVRFDSACKFASHIGADIVINTGDDKFMWLKDGSGFIKDVLDKYPNLDYANCIGNHDTYIKSNYYGGNSNVSEIYAASIEPFVTPYNYVLGDTGKRYYHKDLTSKSIRIIALDIYDGFTSNANYKVRISKAQIDWFIATLASTPNGYGVIVILHQVPHNSVSVVDDKNGFNDVSMTPKFYAIDDDDLMKVDGTLGIISNNPIVKIVDAFIGRTTVSDSYTQRNTASSANETITYSADFTNIDSSVEFIAYLNGHTHRDWVGLIDDCTHRQVNINICSTSGISQSNGLPTNSDIFRGSMGSTQDAFNVYTINRIDKTIGICRIGSNLSKDLRDRKVMFVKYVDDEV